MCFFAKTQDGAAVDRIVILKRLYLQSFYAKFPLTRRRKSSIIKNKMSGTMRKSDRIVPLFLF